MNENNKFQIGEEVIALSSAVRPNQPRKKGRHYIVTGTMYCSTTGEQLINIDDTESKSKSGYLKCKCGHLHFAMGLSWTFSKHFVSPKNIKNRMLQAVEDEDYDTAILLRDLTSKE